MSSIPKILCPFSYDHITILIEDLIWIFFSLGCPLCHNIDYHYCHFTFIPKVCVFLTKPYSIAIPSSTHSLSLSTHRGELVKKILFDMQVDYSSYFNPISVVSLYLFLTFRRPHWWTYHIMKVYAN